MFDNHLKPNGLYVIEDWFTGYWGDWPDGKRLNLESYTQQKFKWRPLWLSWLWAMARLGLKFPMRGHCYGMVGFIKQLIDEQAAHDVTRGRWKGTNKEIKIPVHNRNGFDSCYQKSSPTR